MNAAADRVRAGQRARFRYFVAAALVGFGIFIVAILTRPTSGPPQPAVATTAAVTGIYPHQSHWRQDVEITFRSPDGVVATEILPLSELACHIGDVVPATRQGLSLRPKVSACEKRDVLAVP